MPPPPTDIPPTSPPAALQAYQVGSSTLASLYLIPDYITSLMEQQLLTNITSTKQNWTQVSGRRLQNIGGTVSKKGGLLPIPLPGWIRPLVDTISTDFGDLFGKSEKANHVLINQYNPGEGIFPHEDGPLYWPTVAILSLGAPAVIRFTQKRDEGDICTNRNEDTTAEREGNEEEELTKGPSLRGASVVVPPRSLLIFKDDAYLECLHGLDFVENETLDASVVNLEAVPGEFWGKAAFPRGGIRTSLTVRRVLKVHKQLGFLLKH